MSRARQKSRGERKQPWDRATIEVNRRTSERLGVCLAISRALGLHPRRWRRRGDLADLAVHRLYRRLRASAREAGVDLAALERETLGGRERRVTAAPPPEVGPLILGARDTPADGK